MADLRGCQKRPPPVQILSFSCSLGTLFFFFFLQFQTYTFSDILYSGASKGAPRTRALPRGPNSFIFMQFMTKKLQRNRLAHLFWELAHPPRENPGSVTAAYFILANIISATELFTKPHREETGISF